MIKLKPRKPKTKAKLSRTQQELLSLLQRGAHLHYMDYSRGYDAYFFVTCHEVKGLGKNYSCTAAALALRKKGMIEDKAGFLAKPNYQLTEAGKAWKP